MKIIFRIFLILALSSGFASATPQGQLETGMNKMAKELATTLPYNLERPLVVAVIDFHGDNGRDRADKLAGALAGLQGDFEVVERKSERMQDALRELNFSQSDMANMVRIYKKAMGAAKLPLIRFHDLRHTTAALLIHQGESPKYIQKQMRHASIEITFNRYGHLFPDVNKKAMDGMSEMLFGDAKVAS